MPSEDLPVCSFFSHADPIVEFAGSDIVSVDEDTSSISLTITSSTTGADGLVELYTTDGTATGENLLHC